MREHFVYVACKSLTGCSYFTKDDHQGVCVFRRRRTSEDGHRGFRLSSLGILLAKSPRARPWQHVAALKQLVNTIYTSLEDRDTLEPMESDWDPARTFFEERKVPADLSSPRGWGGWTSGGRVRTFCISRTVVNCKARPEAVRPLGRAPSRPSRAEPLVGLKARPIVIEGRAGPDKPRPCDAKHSNTKAHHISESSHLPVPITLSTRLSLCV